MKKKLLLLSASVLVAVLLFSKANADTESPGDQDFECVQSSSNICMVASTPLGKKTIKGVLTIRI